MKIVFRLLIVNLILTGAIFAQNYKIRQVTTMSGKKSESTIYVKGSRKRTDGGGIMGIGGDVSTVEQCDLKRNLKISDKKKMYAVEPFDDGADASATPNVKTKSAPVTKGGTVTLTSNITDTGERKQMFGLTARRVKSSVVMQASPDACSKNDMAVETDGWYVDLPEFSCPMTRQQVAPMTTGTGGGCRDKMILKNSGSGKLGFALSETRTMNMQGSEMSFTQVTETLEFSKATLDSALFDIPSGYELKANSQDLYGKPDYMSMMEKQGSNDDDDEDKPPTKNNKAPISPVNSVSKAKKAGTIRIGVYAPTNKSGENVSITNLQGFLIQKLTGGKVEAVSIGSEADARSANCDFVLTSDFSKLKQSTASKIGGMFGKITNKDTSSARNYDVQIDFKLVSLADGKTVAQDKAANKTESDVDRAAEAALALEAQQIIGAVQK